MAQPPAHGDEFADGLVQRLRPVRQHAAIDPRPAGGREQGGDFRQREARRLAERDQPQPLQHRRIEQAAQPLAADGADQALFLVEAQRRGRHARQARHLCDIQILHGLDLKRT